MSASIETEHLQHLARQPRHTAGRQIEEARRYCTEVLTILGYHVTERPFAFSAAVGEYGTPAGGLIALIVIVASLGLSRRVGLIILVAGLGVLVIGGGWLARRGVLALPFRRRRGVNLEATRNGATPLVWLVAHLDSKSQPVSLFMRAAGIVLLAMSFIGAIVVPRAALFVGVLAIVGAVPVVASVIGRRSPGAVDNASGVATLLTAASLLPRDARVGILITDAEELGLAGARAWCANHSPAAALNCDGVDDIGSLTVMWTRPRAPRLEAALRAASHEPLRVIPLVPGVLVDGLAFSDAGWEAVTISRGTLGTLRRIHTTADDLQHLQGSAITSTANAMAQAATTLSERR